MLAAVSWAEQHEPESIAGAAMWPVPGAESELALAGEAAPLVGEFCIAEFALAIGRSTDSGRAVIAHATLGLSKEAAQHVARENAERAADGRHITFHHQQVSFNGTTFVEAELDLADALHLDAALARGAELAGGLPARFMQGTATGSSAGGRPASSHRRAAQRCY